MENPELEERRSDLDSFPRHSEHKFGLETTGEAGTSIGGTGPEKIREAGISTGDTRPEKIGEVGTSIGDTSPEELELDALVLL